MADRHAPTGGKGPLETHLRLASPHTGALPHQDIVVHHTGMRPEGGAVQRWRHLAVQFAGEEFQNHPDH